MTDVPCYNLQEYAYDSHESILNDPDKIICCRLTIPQHDRNRVLERLDQMNINAYTLFCTEDTLVETYGLRELRRMRNTT